MDPKSFVMNPAVLDVVRAFMLAYEELDPSDMAELVHEATSMAKPSVMSLVTGIDRQRLYQYRRPDLAARQSHINVQDFVRLVSLIH